MKIITKTEEGKFEMLNDMVIKDDAGNDRTFTMKKLITKEQLLERKTILEAELIDIDDSLVKFRQVE